MVWFLLGDWTVSCYAFINEFYFMMFSVSHIIEVTQFEGVFCVL